MADLSPEREQMQDFVLTSTSVTDGHPDKLCDRISDVIVDAYLARDVDAHVTVECAIASSIAFIAAHVGTEVHLDMPALVQRVVQEAGYRDPDFQAGKVTVLSSVAPRAPVEPAAGEVVAPVEGLNVTVFGYACRHCAEMMPLSIVAAHRLARALSEARLSSRLSWLHPDGQAQVAVRYEGRVPVAIEGVTLYAALQNGVAMTATLRARLEAAVVEPVLAKLGVPVSRNAQITINPRGFSTQGGPARHAGLTGRKNDIDTYGGYSRHAGAALSGKDPSRLDRIGAYGARYAAKNIVAAGLARECEVQVSYAIGLTEPLNVEMDTFGTGCADDKLLRAALLTEIDLSAPGLVRAFGLAHLPRARGGRFFADLSAYGHFGRLDLDLPWEKTDRAPALASRLGLKAT